MSEANENEAGEDAATSSAFTRTAEIEFTEDWKADLEALLRDHQIPLDGEGRLYYVVNTVREILQVKDLQSLHKVNFPLTIHMQDWMWMSAPPQVEKADGFYFWQVEWGALKGSSISTKKEDQNVDAQPPEEEAEDGGPRTRIRRLRKVLHPRVPRSQDGKTRRAGARAPRPRAPYRGTVVPPGPASGYPPEAQDPLQKVLDRFTSTGHVRNQATGGALAQAAAQASIYVPELQEQLYEDERRQLAPSVPEKRVMQKPNGQKQGRSG
eukprot:g30096.t1